MNIQELKLKSSEQLITQAEELGIENASTLRKQEILFAILKKVAEKEEAASTLKNRYPINEGRNIPFIHEGVNLENKIRKICRNFPYCDKDEDCMFLHYRFRSSCIRKNTCTITGCPY